MPLSPPASRTLRHTRAITVEAYARDDGLWDLDACIRDVKTHDIELPSGFRPGGLPVHDLKLRVTIDRDMTIVDAEAASDAGLSLLKHFRLHLKDRLHGVLGCTHLTELAQVLPTAAIQAFADDAMAHRKDDASSGQPYELDRCHALRLDGPVVATFYPRWALKKVSG
jgi:hypothetical protein